MWRAYLRRRLTPFVRFSPQDPAARGVRRFLKWAAAYGPRGEGTAQLQRPSRIGCGSPSHVSTPRPLLLQLRLSRRRVYISHRQIYALVRSTFVFSIQPPARRAGRLSPTAPGASSTPLSPLPAPAATPTRPGRAFSRALSAHAAKRIG